MERPTSSGGSRNRLTHLNLHEHDDDDDDDLTVLRFANPTKSPGTKVSAYVALFNDSVSASEKTE
jgi:hypothetical protein